MCILLEKQIYQIWLPKIGFMVNFRRIWVYSINKVSQVIRIIAENISTEL